MNNNYNPYGGQGGQQGGDNGYLGTPAQGYNEPYSSPQGSYFGSQQSGAQNSTAAPNSSLLNGAQQTYTTPQGSYFGNQQSAAQNSTAAPNSLLLNGAQQTYTTPQGSYFGNQQSAAQNGTAAPSTPASNGAQQTYTTPQGYNNQQGYTPQVNYYGGQQNPYAQQGYGQPNNYAPRPQGGMTPPPNAGYYQNPYAQSGYYSRPVSFTGSAITRNLPVIPNGAVNYMVFLPLLGLFLENFAPALPLGVLLWGMVMIFMRVAAYKDSKNAVEKNVLRDSAKTVAVLAPVVYMFMRCQGLGRGLGRFIAVALTSALALFWNGFTESFKMSPESFIVSAQTRYLSDLGVYEKVDNYEENYMLGDRVDAFVKDADWSYSEFGGDKCVILTGSLNEHVPDEYKGKEIEIKLRSNFDGYNVKLMQFEFYDCELDGDEIKGDDKDDFVEGFTHDWKAPEKTDDDSSEQSSESK